MTDQEFDGIHELVFNALASPGMTPEKARRFQHLATAIMAERQQMQRQLSMLRQGLQWALDEGGWRLWFYAATVPPIICFPTGKQMGSSGRINDDLLAAIAKGPA